jgi:hypothetical protein
MKHEAYLQIAALLHIGLLCAGLTMPRAVNLRQHLATLPAFIRSLFWVYFTFIGSCLVGFGALTWFAAEPMAAGEPVARALAIFLAIFWLTRLCAGIFVFNVRPYLTNWFYRAGNFAINLVFVYLSTIYAWTALKGIL